MNIGVLRTYEAFYNKYSVNICMECSKITLESYETKILQFKMYLEIIIKVVQMYVVNLKNKFYV